MRNLNLLDSHEDINYFTHRKLSYTVQSSRKPPDRRAQALRFAPFHLGDVIVVFCKPPHKLHVKLSLAFLILFLISCSGDEDAPLVIEEQAPEIRVFSADPPNLDQGNSAKLSWRVVGEPPPQLTLTPAPEGGEDVTGRDSVVVAPSEDTTYTLSATNRLGSVERTLRLNVTRPVVLPPSELSVTVNPGIANLAPGQTQVFTASVTGADEADQGVTWQVSEGGGRLEVDGAEATYTAPSATGTYQLTATSVVDPSKSATVTVNVSEVGVSITPASETLAPGQSRTFTAEVMGTDNADVTWEASEGDVDADGARARYSAPGEPGDYTLTATSVADPSKSATATITVASEPDPDPNPDPNEPDPNEAPSANFTFTADNLEVSFDGSSSSDADGSISSYSWDFGDEEMGEGEATSHTYDGSGTYMVTLTVTDDQGKSSTVQKSIEVAGATSPPTDPPTDEAPSADFTFTADNLEVSFDGSSSSDADGSISSYSWDFGDEEMGEGETTSHTYAEPGTYTVTLTVTDDGGKRSTVAKPVEVVGADAPPDAPVNEAPSASFTFSADNLEVSFDGSGSSDDGNITSYDWDFGDGATGEGEAPSHTYAEAGTYMVTLTVTDDGGKSTQTERPIEVVTAPTEPTDPPEPPSNQAPNVLFSFAPSEGDAPLAVDFDASASTDPDGDIVSYAWDFGDDETGEGESASHTYAEAGTYTVTLTLTDNDSTAASASKSVEVFAPETPSPAEATLRLTEISNSAVGSAHWVEVYNASNRTLNLEDYELRTAARGRTSPYRPRGDTTFTLPPLNLPAGGYALVIGETSDEVFDGPRHVHVRGDEVPAWDENGFVELLKDDATADFVRFGSSNEEPSSDGAWGGGSASALADESLARDESNTDTGTASDWTLRTFATAGGPNDVSDASDNDDDGIPDSAEVAGGTFAGLDLYAMGARTSQADIFVEVDYMNTTDAGVVPQRAALDKIVAAFDKEGISLHFDAGTRFSSSFSPGDYNLGGGKAVVPFSRGIAFFDKGSGYANFYQLKARYMDITRRQMFHYLVLANSQRADGGPSSVGLAEVGGNDLFVTLGGLGYGNAATANFQAGSIMHELGHNLGLEHGGDDDTNNKPNYLSVMNYLYTVTGIGPLTGEGARDRYLFSRHGRGDYAGFVNSPLGEDFVIDYSNGSSTFLNESNLNENSGLGRGAAAIDLNDNGSVQARIAFDLNDDGTISTLRDHDDWSNLVLPFRGTGNSEDGISTLNTDTEETFDPLADDRQPIADEPVIQLP